MSTADMNVVFIAVDDLRAQFGRSFNDLEVLTPHMDAFFIDSGGAAMQHSYVQVAVCGPSRTSMLTGRRPDTTHVGTGSHAGWCWCSRGNCASDSLFMTLPTYFRQHGFHTAGGGKLFHPDACKASTNCTHSNGDDPRAWSYGTYWTEANFTQEQWGTIPGPGDAVYENASIPAPEGGVCRFRDQIHGTCTGKSLLPIPLTDEETTDGMMATNAIERLANFSRDGIGRRSANSTPFFLSIGFHKPHLPHIVPSKYYDLYDVKNVSLAPNRLVPTNFLEENFGYAEKTDPYPLNTMELASYKLNAGPILIKDGVDFNTPLDEDFSRSSRRGYFAAVSFVDAQVGRVVDALRSEGYVDNTIVVLWGDHGWHLGDTNSWGKKTNFESATRNALLWRVPGQSAASKGRNERFVESIDIFPTLVELTGLPPLPKCEGIDQPPNVACLQGESYASEFLPEGVVKTPSKPKQYAFSQWPFPAWGNQTMLRQGYTVRSAKGYRYTYYVPYNITSYTGDWTSGGDNAAANDDELYDYTNDPYETTNFAKNASYAAVVAELKKVLLEQYVTNKL
jgi:arylsulfatase A-like enzyme